MTSEPRTFYFADWFYNESGIPPDYEEDVARAFKRTGDLHGLSLGNIRRDFGEEIKQRAGRPEGVDICRVYAADVIGEVDD